MSLGLGLLKIQPFFGGIIYNSLILGFYSADLGLFLATIFVTISVTRLDFLI